MRAQTVAGGRRMIAVAAMAKNRVIGCRGSIPWHLPEDLRFFKKTTMGGVVVMGRKTFDSIGRPLPGRENIVLTSRPLDVAGVRTASSIDALPREMPDGRGVFLIGGAQLYAALLGECTAVLLTVLDEAYEGDAFFPELPQKFRSYTVLEKGRGYEIREFREFRQ